MNLSGAVLGLDAVSMTPGAALWVNGKFVDQRVIEASGQGVPKTERGAARFAGRPGDRLAACLMELAAAHNLAPGDLKGLAVTIGPGSFTGIRVGIALAHGYLQGTRVPAVAIDTFTAASSAVSQGKADQAGRPPLVIVQLRKTNWFVINAGEPEPQLCDAAETNVLGARAFSVGRLIAMVGAPPSDGAAPSSTLWAATTIRYGLASAVAELGAMKLAAEGWPTMDTNQRVIVLAPRYPRETYWGGTAS